MNEISILDCTLRDGGYINKWNFGKETIADIICNLGISGIDIIECGFLRDVPYQEGVSVFSCVSQIIPYIAPKKQNTLYVAMIALGDISVDHILPYDGQSIDGIRLTFHKHEWEDAKCTAQVLKDKGYKVFIQPVGTTSYTDHELLHLIQEVNQLSPYAFYIVDTLGIMYQHDMNRVFYLVENNLDPTICIGFHSHNNLQMSFANAQEFIRFHSKHARIVDASVYGMGRGVGNLSTELIAEYINANLQARYQTIPLLTIADRHLFPIYEEQKWGYALPYFLSAREKCHPNYAAYLLEKETLDMETISKLLSLLPRDKSDLFHPELIETIYQQFQNCKIDDRDTLQKIHTLIHNRSVLILGSGATLIDWKEQIDAYIAKENPIVITTNFIPDSYQPDVLFISNRKRIEQVKKHGISCAHTIATSNLLSELQGKAWFINYGDYLGEGTASDNAGAMLLRLLSKCGVKSLALAGFDGFDVLSRQNYCIGTYHTNLDRAQADQKNLAIEQQLNLALKDIPHQIITPTRYHLT